MGLHARHERGARRSHLLRVLDCAARRGRRAGDSRLRRRVTAERRRTRDGARPACHRSPRELFPAAGQPESTSWRCRDSRCCARRVDRRKRLVASLSCRAPVDDGCSRRAAAGHMCRGGVVRRRRAASRSKRPDPVVGEGSRAVHGRERQPPPAAAEGLVGIRARSSRFRRQPGMSPNARRRTITSSSRPRLPRFMSLRIAGLPRDRRHWRWGSTPLRTISGAPWRG